MSDDNRFDSNHDEPHQSSGLHLRCQPSNEDSTHCDRSNIRVFEAGIPNQPTGNNGYGSRITAREEGQRLIAIAKKNGLYYPPQSWPEFGDQRVKPSGESRIFVNEAMGLVFKVRDPFAKAPIKRIQPQDVIYEHLIHNLLFPSTRYNFVGISENNGGVRIILSQEYVSGWNRPAQEQIDNHLASIGLKKEDGYYYGNDNLAITDVASESDNVLIDENDNIRFIDPLIRFRKPATDILENYQPLRQSLPTDAVQQANILRRLVDLLTRWRNRG